MDGHSYSTWHKDQYHGSYTGESTMQLESGVTTSFGNSWSLVLFIPSSVLRWSSVLCKALYIVWIRESSTGKGKPSRKNGRANSTPATTPVSQWW